MESDDREGLERDLRLNEESKQTQLAALRKKLNLSDEQFEQSKLDAEFQATMYVEQAKQIHDLLESEESDDRHRGLLQLFGYINERESALFKQIAGVRERFDRIIVNMLPTLKSLADEVISLRAEVEALKSNLPAVAKRKKKRVSRKKSKRLLHKKRNVIKEKEKLR